MVIDFDKIAEEYMHDVRAWVIEFGLTSSVLLSMIIASIIGKKAVAQAVVDGTGVLTGEAFNAADAAVAAKLGRHMSNKFVRFAYSAAAKAATGVRALASRVAPSAIVGGILMIDTAAEAVSLAYRVKDLGYLSIKRLSYDSEDLANFGRALTAHEPAKDEVRGSVSVTQDQAALLVLLTSEKYSTERLDAKTTKAFRLLYETLLESEQHSNEVVDVELVAKQSTIDLFQRFVADLNAAYGSVSRDDLLVINLLAIVIGKVKFRALEKGWSTFQVAAKLFAIGE